MSRINLRVVLADPESRSRLLTGATEFLKAISREHQMSNMPYICPKCGRDDALSVMVSVMARLTQYGDGNIETDASGDHNWDGHSYMTCRACGHVGSAYSFGNPSYVEE